MTQYNCSKYVIVCSVSCILVRSAQASAGGAGWWEFAAMCALALTTVFGNGAVLLALRRVPSTSSRAPLTSLAVADLLLGLTVLPLAAAREHFVFYIDQVWCSLWSTMDVFCCTASILSLCALGWERWSGVTEPLKKAKRTRLARLHSWLLWPVAVVVAAPTALVPTRPSDKPCVVNTNIGYVFYSITISFYIPASVMVILYVRVLTSLAAPLNVRAHRGSRSPATPRTMPTPRTVTTTTTIEITTTRSMRTPISTKTRMSQVGPFPVTANGSPAKILITMTESIPKLSPGSRDASKLIDATVSPSKFICSSEVCEEDTQQIEVKQNPMIGECTAKAHHEKTILKNLKLFLSPNKRHLGVPAETFIRVTPKRRGPVPLKKGPETPGHMRARQRRATRAIVLLMSLFLICWTPFFVMLPIDAMCGCVGDVAWRWCTWLGYANSALDPLVYATASPGVRKALHSTISLSRSDPTTSGNTPTGTPRARGSKIAKSPSKSPNRKPPLFEIVEMSNVKVLSITKYEL